jgi:hypothetical protein
MNKEWAQKERLQMNFWPQNTDCVDFLMGYMTGCTCATLDDPVIPPKQEPQLHFRVIPFLAVSFKYECSHSPKDVALYEQLQTMQKGMQACRDF